MRFLTHQESISGLLRARSNQHQFENSNETEQLYLECLIPSMKTSGPNGTSSVFASEGFVTKIFKDSSKFYYIFLKCYNFIKIFNRKKAQF